MKRLLSKLFLLFLAVAVQYGWAASDPRDYQNSKDPALFTRMPGFYLSSFEDVDFGNYAFTVAKGKKLNIEGHYLYYDYYLNDGSNQPSGMQIARNYSNAAKMAGGKVIYSFEDGGTQFATMKFTRGGTETWAEIEGAGNGIYKLRIVEKKVMNQAVVADANSLATGIKDTGKAAVYGILFDNDKAEIKPESQAAMDEIAKLLKGDPSLKLYVVGHTDNAGGFDHNITLSNARAAAVVAALTAQYRIARARLTPFGDGPTAPVASNATEDGRARNRRVELVAQ